MILEYPLLIGSDSWAEMLFYLEREHRDNVSFYFQNNVFPIEEKEEGSRYRGRG